MFFINEAPKETPVRDQAEVVVCGGGVAGIAAALSAARAGARTLLIEREFALGGLATLGLVTIYLPLDDGEKQVSFGIAEELLRLSIKHGAEGRYPAAWLDRCDPEERKTAQRFEVQYNAALFAMLAEQLLLDAGVQILYGTSVVGAAVDNGRITHLITENKSGREAIAVRSVVDSTGDADLTRLAGEESATYSHRNVLAAWYYFLKDAKYGLKMLGYAEDPNKPSDDAGADGKNKRYVGLDGHELSELVCDSHASTLRHFLSEGELTDDHAIATIATIPQLRMTRRVVGVETMNERDDHRYCESSVGIFSNWRRRGPAYELPFGALYGRRIRNLLFAGRCFSADDTLWEISRVIPVCAVSGEAAGLAAAMGDDMHALPVARVQEALRKRGVPLHICELE